MDEPSAARQLAWSAVFALPLPVKRRALYAYYHRRIPDFTSPRSFTEKINWRILHDRRPKIARTCDKLRVKELAERAGVQAPQAIWSGTDVRELAAVPMPDRWVLKPNHRSQLFHFGFGPATDTAELQCITHGWLSEREGVGLGEWAYTKARPLLLAEQMLGDGTEPPLDYRFFTYGPDVRYVQVDTGKPGVRRRFYSKDWEPLEVRQRYPMADPIPCPENFERMMSAASMLGREYDFMRVDLYNVAGDIYLGELTPYPTGGLASFTPRSFDLELGSWWQLPLLQDVRSEHSPDGGD